ncbi:MAG: GTP-binding protein [Promethearchaeota archaeon]
MTNSTGSFGEFLLYLKVVRDLFKFCLIGDGGVGKSTFLYYLRTGDLADKQDIERTPYINIESCILGGHNLQLYDLAGQRRKNAHPLDHIQAVVFKEVDVLLFFFSLNNFHSFLNVRKWYEEIKTIYDIWEQPLPTMYLVGNKLDLPREVESLNGEELVKSVPGFKGYFEISLFSGKNVDRFLKAICEELEAKLFQYAQYK